jgi:hypothetical protein
MGAVRPAVAAFAAASVVAGVGVSATRAASADVAPPVLSAVTTTPATGVVLATVTSPSATVTIAARVVDASGVDRVVLGLYDPAGRKPDGRVVTAVRTLGTAKDGTWVAKLTLPSTEPVGRWTVRGFATDLAGNMSEPDAVHATFLVRHPTRFAGFNASPEPVDAGAPVTLAGVLQRFKPGSGWVPYAGRLVQVEFRATGSTAWTKVGAARTTDASGAYGIPAPPASAAGAWRVTYAGNPYRAPSASHSDTVELS